MKKLFLAAALTAACSLSAIAQDPCHWTDGDDNVHNGRTATLSNNWSDSNTNNANNTSHLDSDVSSNLAVIGGNVKGGESNSRGAESTKGYTTTLTREVCADRNNEYESVYYEKGWSK